MHTTMYVNYESNNYAWVGPCFVAVLLFIDVRMVCVENVMYAVQNSLNQWRRGIVIHEFKENGENYYTVHCVDYGYTETVKGIR